MSRGPAGLLALLLSVLAGPLAGAGAAPPRPAELPAPELLLTVATVPLNVTRLPIEPPAPPPLPRPALDLGSVPLPRFLTTVAKPLPVVKDPGGFSCVFVAFRRAASVAECGVHRALAGDLRAAREALEESLAIDPRGGQVAMASLWLGEIALVEGRFDQAERHYRAAVAQVLPPELVIHAEIGLGILALRRGDAAEAERALARSLAAGPPQPVALVARYFQGMARLLAERPAEALTIWDTVAQSGATGRMVEELPFWRGVALGWDGNADLAVKTLDEFAARLKTHPLRADAIVQAGWIRLERGAPDEAERRFLEAEAMGPRPELRPQLHAGLVRVYLDMGDSTRAASAARRLAIEAPRDPLVGPALLTIAEAATARGAPAETLDIYRQLLLLPLRAPLQDYVTYRLGEELEREGVLAEAKERYRALQARGRDEGIAERASYRLGLIALREKDLGAARREGETLVRGGTVAELREGALLLAGEAAARGDDPNRAVAAFRLALRERPASPRASRTRLALGWALFKERDVESAIREWQALLSTGDLDVRRAATLAIADAHLGQGREKEALEALNRLGPLPPGHPQADAVLLDRGLLALRAQAYGEAIQALEPVAGRISDFPLQARVRRALGVARYHVGEFDQAERQFRQAASVAPAEPSSWLGAGLAALMQSRLTEAEDALGRARLAVPEVATVAQYGLVLVPWMRQDGATFRERATAFVDRFPTHAATPALLYALATSALDRGEIDEGQTWVRRLVRDQPEGGYVPDALSRLTVAARSRPDVLREAYRELLTRSTSAEVRVDAWLGLAEAALASGDAGETRRAVEAFLRDAVDDPRAARAQALLVRAYRAQGDGAQALAAAESFLARFPKAAETPAVQLVRGDLLVAERRWEAAQQAFEAARDQGEPVVAAPASFWLGETLRARGNDEGAIAAYLGGTYLYPETPWAARGLQGAAQSYVSRRMPREAAILLRKLVASPAAEPALVQWARSTLAKLGPIPEADPVGSIRKGTPPRP